MTTTIYNILVLTNHSSHTKENSVYSLVNTIKGHPQCGHLFVASRGNSKNDSFFNSAAKTPIYAHKIEEKFEYQEADKSDLVLKAKPIEYGDFDIIFLRLARPLSDEFLIWLQQSFPDKIIINNPQGIIKTSSKEYLLNFPELCPEMQLVSSIEEIKNFTKKYKTVLKPLRDYGGRGILMIDGDEVDLGTEKVSLDDYLHTLQQNLEQSPYLAMKYLKNVSQGDKRILVVNGKIMASSLRLPPEGSWLCNVAQGGSSVQSEVTKEEEEIVEAISPNLLEKGIVFCGVDTLVNDEGKRVLSEINTMSIGGFMQSDAQTGKPVLKDSIKEFFKYINTENDKRKQ